MRANNSSKMKYMEGGFLKITSESQSVKIAYFGFHKVTGKIFLTLLFFSNIVEKYHHDKQAVPTNLI
jgi:hypothetical protein